MQIGNVNTGKLFNLHSSYEEWLNNYKEKTKNQPTRNVSMNIFLNILRAGKDNEGNKVIDKYCTIQISNLWVELPDGQWRCYAAGYGTE